MYKITNSYVKKLKLIHKNIISINKSIHLDNTNKSNEGNQDKTMSRSLQSVEELQHDTQELQWNLRVAT